MENESRDLTPKVQSSHFYTHQYKNQKKPSPKNSFLYCLFLSVEVQRFGVLTVYIDLAFPCQ